MSNKQGVTQTRRREGGDGGQGASYFDDMTPAELKERDDGIKAYEAIQARQDAYMQRRRAESVAQQSPQKPERRGCVFAKCSKLPDAVINYTDPTGFVPVDSLSDYGHFAILGARQADSSGLVPLEIISGAFAVIESGARIAAGVTVGAHCFIGARCEIGADGWLAPRVTLYHDVRIGERVVIQSGAVIGGEGFGFANAKGIWHKIAQVGGVLIGDDVEIGVNTAVDRGALADTVIGNGVKLDNQIQIAHNVQIGDHTAMAACVGISGSTKIGKHCMLAGGVGLVGHIEICDNVFITGMTMVTHSITEPGAYSSGTAMQPAAEWRKSAARLRQLDDMARRLKQLEKRVGDVTPGGNASSEG